MQKAHAQTGALCTNTKYSPCRKRMLKQTQDVPIQSTLHAETACSNRCSMYQYKVLSMQKAHAQTGAACTNTKYSPCRKHMLKQVLHVLIQSTPHVESACSNLLWMYQYKVLSVQKAHAQTGATCTNTKYSPCRKRMLKQVFHVLIPSSLHAEGSVGSVVTSHDIQHPKSPERINSYTLQAPFPHFNVN